MLDGDGDKYKLEFLNFFKQSLGAKDFLDGFKNYKFNIFVDKDVKNRLPLKFKSPEPNKNEKEPSS